MKPTIKLNDAVDLETINAPTKTDVSSMVLANVESLETTTPQQLYEEGMENVWNKVNQLPEGQDKVALSQIWEFGKTSHHSISKSFPALVSHGFMVEQLVEGQRTWKPSSPYLKDFWHVGIDVSNAYGYSLQPRQAFQARLEARICTLFKG